MHGYCILWSCLFFVVVSFSLFLYPTLIFPFYILYIFWVGEKKYGCLCFILVSMMISSCFYFHANNMTSFLWMNKTLLYVCFIIPLCSFSWWAWGPTVYFGCWVCRKHRNVGDTVAGWQNPLGIYSTELNLGHLLLSHEEPLFLFHSFH